MIIDDSPATPTKRKRDQIRLDNLELLIKEAGSGVALARRAGTSPSYLSQVRREFTTVSGTPRSVGDQLATKLEQGMDKPQGWMDEDHTQGALAGNAHRVETRNSRLHPVISWEQAGRWAELAWQFKPSDAGGMLVCPIDCSKNTFVLRVNGPSMEPKFRDGELIFVDPDVEATNGKFVVVRLRDSNEATFRQLIVENERRYLQALNRDWPSRRIVEINENTAICGVVVFKGETI